MGLDLIGPNPNVGVALMNIFSVAVLLVAAACALIAGFAPKKGGAFAAGMIVLAMALVTVGAAMAGHTSIAVVFGLLTVAVLFYELWRLLPEAPPPVQGDK